MSKITINFLISNFILLFRLNIKSIQEKTIVFLFNHNQETKDFKEIIQINLRENDSDELVEVEKENFKVIDDSEVIIGGLKDETTYEVRLVVTTLDGSTVIFTRDDLYTRGKAIF